MKPITLACLICCFAIASLSWLGCGFGPPDKITNLADYPSTLQEWSSTGLVAHFPASVPPQAQNVRFSALPGYLQGGAHLQLRMQLPADEVAAIEARLAMATTHVYDGGGVYDHYNKDQDNNWPTTSFHTADNPRTSSDFPTHYKLYVLSATNRGSWNHGKTTGAAISTKLNEVIYWADSW